jgi:DNA-directed RNA polymerase subunit RPC12/RpoP
MPTTLIIVCSHCGGLLLAAEDKKTRTCPHCSKRIDVQKSVKIASAKDAFEASELLREIKRKRQSNVRSN